MTLVWKMSGRLYVYVKSLVFVHALLLNWYKLPSSMPSASQEDGAAERHVRCSLLYLACNMIDGQSVEWRGGDEHGYGRHQEASWTGLESQALTKGIHFGGETRTFPLPPVLFSTLYWLPLPICSC